jgi:CCR4-NOT transcriptional complex subunit CAF120
MDPREERTSHLRAELKKLLQQHVRPPVQVVQNSQVYPQMTGTPPIPPFGGVNTDGALPPLPPPDGNTQASGSQLPPLSTAPNGLGNAAWQRPLTPIAEGGSVVTHGRSNSDVFVSNQSPSTSSPLHGEAGPSTSVLGGPIFQNPPSGPIESPVPLQSASAPPTAIIAPVIPALPLFSRPPQTPRTPPVSNSVPVGAQQFDGVKKLAGQGSPVNLTDQPGPGPTQSITSPAVSSSVPNVLATQKFQTQEMPPFVPRQAVPAVLPVADPSSFTSTKPFTHQVAPSASLSSSQDDLMNQPGALYYIQQQDESSSSGLLGTSNIPTLQKQRAVQPDSEGDSEDDQSSLNIAAPIPKDPAGLNPYAGIHNSSDTGIDIDQEAPPIRRGTPMSFTEASSIGTGSAGPIVKPLLVGRMSPNRSGLGRKPSGARELNTSRVYRPESFSSPTSTEPEPIESESKMDDVHPDQLQNQDDVNAVLSYLSIAETDVAGPSSSSTVVMTQSMPGETSMSEHTGAQVVHDNSASVPAVLVQAPAGPAGDTLPYKSSFAPSNKAAERKAKAQAQMEAQLAAAHKPGRANGKRKSKIAGAWESSEDEEEEEEEEDDVNSEGEILTNAKGLQSISSHQNLSSSAVSGRSMQLQHVSNDSQQEVSPSQLRPPRNLPQIPGAQNNGECC